MHLRLPILPVFFLALCACACGSEPFSLSAAQAQDPDLQWPSSLRPAAVKLGQGDGFSTCRFNFGTAWENGKNFPTRINYVTIWASGAESGSFNQYWHGEMLKACKPGGRLAGKTPVFYSYIIAFQARRTRGYHDCNMGTPNLCQQGANYIRQNRAIILAEYDSFAASTAQAWGTSDPIIWLMEPDFFQYASKQQEGGGIEWDELGKFMHEIVSKVRTHLPNAFFSMDVSPWNTNPFWYQSFQMSDFAFLSTSGGGTQADAERIRRADGLTWAQAFKDNGGRRIIADVGYGVGGQGTGHDSKWDSFANINARISDGVIAITQADPGPNWDSVISAAQGQLTKPANCIELGPEGIPGGGKPPPPAPANPGPKDAGTSGASRDAGTVIQPGNPNGTTTTTSPATPGTSDGTTAGTQMPREEYYYEDYEKTETAKPSCAMQKSRSGSVPVDYAALTPIPFGIFLARRRRNRKS